MEHILSTAFGGYNAESCICFTNGQTSSKPHISGTWVLLA